MLKMRSGGSTSLQISTVGGQRETRETVDAEALTDLFFASNLSVVKAQPNFYLMRSSPLPSITGDAKFVWSDRYDWDRNKFQSWLPLIPTVQFKGSGASFLSYEDIDDLQAWASHVM